MKKKKLVYRTWLQLSLEEMKEADKRLVKGQKRMECKYGYNAKGELIRILDFGALSDIFSV